MEINSFIEKFTAKFDDTDTSELKKETVFKELEEWSSLLAISIVGMVDEEYGVRLNGSDILSCQTIEDLYNNVRAKM